MPQDKEQYIKLPENLYDNVEQIYRSQGSFGFTSNINTSTKIKSTFTKSDYDYYRQNGLGTRQSVVNLCQQAYEKVGIVQNVINLMSDFASKGIRIRHSDPEINKFCEKFSEKVNIPERSERFISSFYRLGAAAVYRKYGRASNKITSKYIPIKYTFLNPAALEVDGEQEGIIPDKFRYKIKYSTKVNRLLHSDEVKTTIPEELKKYQFSLKNIPENKLKVFNYRRDDWQFWGLPITYPILDDLQILEKLKLSDISALDGAVSNIRLWTIGKITEDPRTTFLPSNTQLKKFSNILSQAVSGGSMDLIFGPEVDFKESSTDVHKFLGEEKYKPTLDSIYDSLGIPSPLRSSNKDNNNSNVISLKTLVERLNYGRSALVKFWKEEFKEIFEILGFKTEEEVFIEFDTMVLTDEAAEKKLLLDMIDRDIVDMETVLERFNLDPTLVKNKLKNEMNQRGGEVPQKSSPYHDPHIEDKAKHQLLNEGLVYPDEIGLDIKVDKSEIEKRRKNKAKEQSASKKTFSDTPGRPRNITETKKRDTTKSSSKTKAVIWATKAQKDISDIFTPAYLKAVGKKNVRSLTSDETQNLEIAKAKILMNIEPFQDITDEVVVKALGEINKNVDDLISLWDTTAESMGDLTVDQKRGLTSIYYSEEKI